MIESNNPIICPLPRADLPRAAEMIRASFASVAREFGITKENCPRHTSFITVEELEAGLDRGWLPFGLYGLSADGQWPSLQGYVSLSEEGEGVFKLHNLAVLPERRHKGYGKQLLDFLKAKVTELGGNKITLGMIEENTVLKAWYAANGFVHTGTKKFPHLPFTVGFFEWTAV